MNLFLPYPVPKTSQRNEMEKGMYTTRNIGIRIDWNIRNSLNSVSKKAFKGTPRAREDRYKRRGGESSALKSMIGTNMP